MNIVTPSVGSHRQPPTPELPVVLLTGNPNTGKTTLFNALSGEAARVGNYPGITVERRATTISVRGPSGRATRAQLVDLPGAYSLSARSPEERVSFEALLGINGHPLPQLVVVVVDAGQLARNLYLLVQTMELSVPTIVAVNMLDEVKPAPDLVALSERLGVRCVGTAARKMQGIDELRHAIDEALAQARAPELTLEYSPRVIETIDRVARELPLSWQLRDAQRRPAALWAMMSLGDDELHDIPPTLREVCRQLHEQLPEHDLDMDIVRARYDWIEQRTVSHRSGPAPHPPKRPISERIDRVMLHPVLGFLVFALITLMLFQLLFVGADPLIKLVEAGVSSLQTVITHHMSPSWPRDLLVKGIIGGVGNVVVFLPQIALLFALIGLLEDSGYMSRVAFLIDRVMRILGLHGRAFVPMISGFACAVPAIMATRTLERQRDRLLTMMVIPLMTCSARLPVYTLIIGALFPPLRVGGWLPIQGALMVGLYGFSIVAALLAAWALGRTVIKAHRVPLILELPPYRMPHFRSIARMVASRSGDFLREAGTIIMVCTIALWALLAFPMPERQTTTTSDATAAVTSASPVAAPIERSPGARLGRALEPMLQPLGFDWRIGVGLVGSFAAREVFVSTMALVYGISDDAGAAVPLRERMRTERRRDGSRPYSPLVGASLLAFFAIACQCSSTLAVVRRETRSWRWPLFLFAYTGVLAWLTSFAIYQGGKLIGLS